MIPLGAMIVTFVGFIFMGLADFGWLLGMALAIIIAVAMIFREGRSSRRFYVVLMLFLLVHAVIFTAILYTWPTLPAKALSPIFIPDFIAMAYLFPKLTGLAFDRE